MRRKNAVPTLLVGVFSFAALSQTAYAVPVDANYYVRPLLQVGSGAYQDGLEYNGATEATQSQSVSGSSWSTVDLGNGTAKMYSEGSAGLPGLLAFGGFGEKLTITGGAGTFWDLSYAMEGSFSGDLEFVTPGSSNPHLFYNLGLVVFAAGVADATNFLGIANDPCWGQDPLNCTPAPAALANVSTSEFFEAPVLGGEDDFFETFFRQVTASVFLPTNNEVLELFVYSNVIVDAQAGAGLANYVADFSQTASFAQQFAPGVDAYSSSGEFLGLVAPPDDPPPNGVPAPGVLGLFGLGLLALGWTRRKPA